MPSHSSRPRTEPRRARRRDATSKGTANTSVSQSLPNQVRRIHSTSRYCPGKTRPSTDWTTISTASTADRMYCTFIIIACSPLPSYSLILLLHSSESLQRLASRLTVLYSPKCLEVNFSHSGAKGVGYAPHQSPLKEVIELR